MLCPKPLIMVKKALTELAKGDALLVLLDNETARDNVMRFLQDNGCSPIATEGDNQYSIQASKRTDSPAVGDAEAYCRPDVNRPQPVFAITQNGMGKGSDELGKILIQACVNTIKEISPKPSAIVFYNSGVQLACEGSPVLSSLSELEKQGVNILACGTCLDYYDLKKSLKVGRVSNMLDILQTMSKASHVIAP